MKERMQQGEVDEDPILTKFNPARYLGSTSDKMYEEMRGF